MKKAVYMPLVCALIIACSGCTTESSSSSVEFVTPSTNEVALTVAARNEDLMEDVPTIYIYHAHTSETYADTGSVVDVGGELATCLQEKHNFNVIHDTTIYDHDLRKSYEESLDGINSFTSQGQVPDLFIDIHRDDSTTPSAILARDKKTAKIDIIVAKGSGYEERDRPNFRKNFQFASQLYTFLYEIEPEIVNQITVKDTGRYNQHVGTSVLLSIGNDCDTYEDAMTTVPIIADAMAEIIKSRS